MLCGLLFINAAVILLAIFNIKNNVKKAGEKLRAELSTTKLVHHFVVSMLFACSILPLLFFVNNFFGEAFLICQLVVVVLCAVSELGLLRIFGQICTEAI